MIAATARMYWRLYLSTIVDARRIFFESSEFKRGLGIDRYNG